MKKINSFLTLLSVLILFSCNEDDPTPPTLSVSANAAYVSSENLSVDLSASFSPKEAEISECGFYYGEDANLADSSKVTASLRGDGTFSASRIFQDFGKTYYYKAYIKAKNGHEESSPIKSFSTLEFGDYVELQSPHISFDYGTCVATTSTHLSLATGISLTDRGICYGEDENPEQEGKGKTVSAGAGNSDFTAPTGQLQKAKTYYVRSFVKQGNCTAYSDVVSFRTDAAFKALKIIPASGWVLAPGAALEFKVFRIGSDDTELDVTSSSTWEYSVGTLSQDSGIPSKFNGSTEGAAYVKATYKDVASDRTESVHSDGEVSEQSTVEYTDPQVSVEVTKDIPAAGGSIRPQDCRVSYSQIKITHYSGGHDDRDTITSGGEVTFTPEEISAPSLGTTVKERSKVGSFTVTVTMNGKSGSTSADVYQEANGITDITYSDPQVSVTVTKDIPAGGGSISQEYCKVSYSQIKTTRFNGTETKETLTSGGQITLSSVSAPSLGTTVKERSKVGSVTATVSMNGKSGKSQPADVYQQANKIEETIFEVPQVSLNVTKDIPASGGSVTAKDCNLSYSQKKTCRFTSTKTTEETITSGGEVTFTPKEVSAPSLGTTIKERSKVGSITAMVKMNGKSGSASADVYQEANGITDITYSDPQVSVTVTKDIPAGGGSISQEYCKVSYSQIKTTRFNGTEAKETLTSGGQITLSSVSAPSLGTTLKERSKVGSVTATVSMNGKSGKSQPADVYQQANKIEETIIGELQASLTVNKEISAGGGSVTKENCNVSYSQKKTCRFTSGEPTEETITSGGEVTFTPEEVSAPSLGATLKERSKVGSITATVKLNGKSYPASADVFQQANAIEKAAIRLDKSALILNETTNATGTISFTSKSEVHQGDYGVTFGAQDETVVSCTPNGLITGRSSITSATDTHNMNGRSTYIFLSYKGMQTDAFQEILVRPRLYDLYAFYGTIKVGKWTDLEIYANYGSIFDGKIIQSCSSLVKDYEDLEYYEDPITVGYNILEINRTFDQITATDTGKTKLKFYYATQWERIDSGWREISVEE